MREEATNALATAGHAPEVFGLVAAIHVDGDNEDNERCTECGCLLAHARRGGLIPTEPCPKCGACKCSVCLAARSAT